MKGDPGGTIVCPLCPAVRTASRAHASRNGTLTTEATLRGVIRQHLLDTHPDLGPRDRSLLVDEAICAHHHVTPLLERWTADGPRPFQCVDCDAVLGT